MNINAKTKLCGLIGNPVEHSLSPLIHNTISERINNNMCYTTFKVENEGVSDAINGAYALSVLGMNVTVPHKQNVMPYLKNIDPLAKAIGAVNTLVRVDGGYKGYNTDIIGLRRSLLEEGVNLNDKKVIILGAGGASRAICFLCASEGAKEIFLLNRTLAKANEISNSVNDYFGKNVMKALNMEAYREIPKDEYVCIQTTSVGLYPNVDDVVIDDESFYDLVSVGVDIIYNPYVTKFMKKCREKGKLAINGMKMLLYQGVAAYELWNDTTVPKEVCDEVYELLKKEFEAK